MRPERDRRISHTVLWRLVWIDARLVPWCVLQRADLRRAFDISIPQASGDLALFQRLFPERTVYDRSLKGYVPRGDYVFPGDVRAAAAQVERATPLARRRIEHQKRAVEAE